MNDVKALSVTGLRKRYPGFALEDVSFSVGEGKIAGFIGRNGAGKTTTLKSMLNLVHPDGGEVLFFGKPFSSDELSIKKQIGFVSGGVNYYPTAKLKTITGVNRRFYPNWDDAAYRRCLSMFDLDENKTPASLSEGMKVKYALALALSHHAKLLLLDEPTSGLDPVSRDDLLDVFLRLVRSEGVSILFSTHITSDLEKCADDIVYIKNGRIVADLGLDDFLAGYKAVHIAAEPGDGLRDRLIGVKPDRTGYVGLIRTADLPLPDPGAVVRDADLETVMIHMERE